MKVIKSEQLIPCDIDDTLVVWGKIPSGAKVILFTDPYTKEQKYVRVHEAHLKIFTSRLARGATMLVWSASGYKWAEAVLKGLELNHPNILIASKPIAYIDDKPANKWMGERIYLPIDSQYGK